MIHALRRDFFGIGPWAKFKRANAVLDEMLYATIRKRRSEKRKDDDIITLLLDARYDDGTPMTDHEIRDQLITLMFAGNETTAAALAWALHWLFYNPGPQQRLMDELATLGPDPDPEALTKLSYLQAVCHEALRIRPIVPHVLRLLKKPLRLGAYELPAGIALDASVILLHSREDLYPDHKVFRPERFLDRKFAPNEFMPFGGAARRCLGAAFALYEMKIVLGTIMSRHRFQPRGKSDVRSVRHGLVMIPSDGVRATVSA
jgi:cytochrome P450